MQQLPGSSTQPGIPPFWVQRSYAAAASDPTTFTTSSPATDPSAAIQTGDFIRSSNINPVSGSQALQGVSRPQIFNPTSRILPQRVKKALKPGSALNSSIKAAERRPAKQKAIFVSWLDYDLLSTDLQKTLVDVEGIASALCIRLRTKNPNATHSSFYVSCASDSDFGRISDPSIWPLNCIISDFGGPLRDNLKHDSELRAAKISLL